MPASHVTPEEISPLFDAAFSKNTAFGVGLGFAENAKEEAGLTSALRKCVRRA
jgi:hypothetical protein